MENSLRFDFLEDGTRSIIAALLDARIAATKDLQDQTRAIFAMLNNTELVIRESTDRTRQVIIDALADQSRLQLTSSESEDSRIEVTEALSTTRSREQTARRAVEKRVLEDLSFPSMGNRRQEITPKHQKTFEWVFEESSEEQRPWSNFADWLREGNGTYWINGKAGSGKSTLMRFIYESTQTRQELQKWAGSTPFMSAGYFFWNSGTFEQRSLAGLLRSLLHEALSRHPALISIVLPWYWAVGYSQAVEAADPAHASIKEFSFTESRLLQAFEALVKQRTVPMKTCLFIDGLDEYEGDYEKIAELLKDISTSSYVKVCVASRPLLDFEDAFESSPGLRLQDLSFNDIRQYVDEELRKNQRFELLAQDEPKLAPALVHEIVVKSQGVFLWVFLVVRSLLSGLKNRDNMANLQRRLDILPSELEALYDHMFFKRLDKFYLENASRIIQIVRAARQQLRDSAQRPFTVLDLSLAMEDPKVAIDTEIKPISSSEKGRRCQLMNDRLKVSCAGLLEIQGAEDRWIDDEKTAGFKVEGRVQYLHRTVRDYLESAKIWGSLVSHTSNSDFHPYRSLFTSLILALKVHRSGITPVDLSLRVHAAMAYAFKADSDTGQPHVELVDALDRVMGHWCTPTPVDPSQNPGSPGHWTGLIRSPGIFQNQGKPWHDTFLTFAIQYSLRAYVKEKLRRDPSILSARPGRPLLHYAVHPASLDSQSQYYPVTCQMVTFLLDQGCDPNETFAGNSAWSLALISISKQRERPNFQLSSKWLDIVKVLLDNGADTTYAQSRLSAATIISQLFWERTPAETAAFLKIIDEKRSAAAAKKPARKVSRLDRFKVWRRKEYY